VARKRTAIIKAAVNVETKTKLFQSRARRFPARQESHAALRSGGKMDKPNAHVGRFRLWVKKTGGGFLFSQITIRTPTRPPVNCDDKRIDPMQHAAVVSELLNDRNLISADAYVLRSRSVGGRMMAGGEFARCIF
jgi:hypothetical protein